MKNTLILLGLALIIFSFKVDNLIKKIDSFKINKSMIEVFFFDPSSNILEKYPDFNSMAESKKSKTWNEYLHNNVIYMFSKQDYNSDKIYYVIHGNPEITNSKMFFKVQVVKGITSDSFNPMKDDYKDEIVSEIKQVNCGGSLFENMDLFNDKKELIGKGIKFLGYFCRIQPYSEIKESMIEIMKNN
jgi:hypothetical protein